MKNKKISLGQFFTVNAKKIFELKPFQEWFSKYNLKTLHLLEPFAGNNDIPNALLELSLIEKDNFSAFDIDPKFDNIKKQDTLKNFPKNYDLVITNPPYLSKTSASFKKIKYDFKESKNLYEIAIENALKHSVYSAFIIPESFITNQNFSLKKHCEIIISITISNVFNDTNIPICLALFNKNITHKKSDLKIKLFNNNDYVGLYSEIFQLIETNLKYKNSYNISTIKVNEPDGLINVKCFDNKKIEKEEDYIHLTLKDIVNKDKVKQTSRSLTKIKLFDRDNKEILDLKILQEIVKKSNEKINFIRETSQDLYLTYFKDLNSLNKNRRRLSFTLLKKIIFSI